MQKSIFDTIIGASSANIFEKVDAFFDISIKSCIFIAKIQFSDKTEPQGIVEYIERLLPVEGSCIILELLDDTTTYLINYAGDECDKEEVLRMMFSDLNTEMNCKIAISGYSENPMKIASLYDEATLAATLWDSNSIVLYNDIKNISQQDNVIYPYKLLENLSENLYELNFDASKGVITRLFTLLDLKKSPEFFIRCLLIDILTLIVNAMNESNMRFDKYKDIYLETLYMCRSSEYIQNEQEILNAFKNIINIFEQEKSNSTIQISQIKKYINDTCFERNFSIVALSDKFGVSVAYMGYVFKKKSDMNLSDYIWQIRMDKAIELLVNSSTPINDISMLVGYDNPSSFRRKFKETTGLSPSQYRNSK